MRQDIKTWLKPFLIEAAVYAALVFAYYFLALRFFSGWLTELFQNEKRVYAAVALLLIVGQGIVLEILTRTLLSFLQPRSED